MAVGEPEPLYEIGDRVLVVAHSGDDDSLPYKDAYGAVLGSFPNGTGVDYEVLLDDERLVELHEPDLAPQV